MLKVLLKPEMEIEANAVFALHLLRDSAAQVGDAVESGVGVQAAINGALRAATNGLGHLSVADSLRQVDAANLVALHRHDADFRLYNVRRGAAEARHLFILLAQLL